MAQLRDRQTSVLIAEGTPIALALIAERIGYDDVLFDDSGAGFDAAAALASHRAWVAALPSGIPDPTPNITGPERAARLELGRARRVVRDRRLRLGGPGEVWINDPPVER